MNDDINLAGARTKQASKLTLTHLRPQMALNLIQSP
jgi:hypothetical protein